MANRVLSADERQNLLVDPAFKAKCQWAVRDYANFWAAHTGYQTVNGGADGGIANTEAARLKWAKDRLLGVSIQLADVQDEGISRKFLDIGKGSQLDLAASPVDNTTIINALVAGNKFDEFSGVYFTNAGESINMTVGGN